MALKGGVINRYGLRKALKGGSMKTITKFGQQPVDFKKKNVGSIFHISNNSQNLSPFYLIKSIAIFQDYINNIRIFPGFPSISPSF